MKSARPATRICDEKCNLLSSKRRRDFAAPRGHGVQQSRRLAPCVHRVEQRFRGWYINLETVKTEVGHYLDTIDLHLDVWIAPDLTPETSRLACSNSLFAMVTPSIPST